MLKCKTATRISTKRHAEAEAHKGRASRAHRALQIFLQRGADVLQEGGGDSDGDPEFHADLFGGMERESKRPQTFSVFPKCAPSLSDSATIVVVGLH